MTCSLLVLCSTGMGMGVLGTRKPVERQYLPVLRVCFYARCMFCVWLIQLAPRDTIYALCVRSCTVKFTNVYGHCCTSCKEKQVAASVGE